MKKLLLITGTIVFIGNITGQNTSVTNNQPGLVTACKLQTPEVMPIQTINCYHICVIETDLVTTTEPTSGSFDSKSSQGPFTGLGGHNFIEDPAIIYPNPVKDVLNIKSTDPITVIEILGIHGQVEMELDPRSTMDVSTLAAGTYYARIHFENIKDVQVEKILVVK